VKPLLLVVPTPRARWMILADDALARLEADWEVVLHEPGPAPDTLVERCLPEVVAILGQVPLPEERLARAPKLRAVVNVKGNWEPTLDYAACARRGIEVLSIAPAMAPAVAEMALGLALDLARGISAADRDFRAGRERWGIAGNLDAFLLRDAPLGMIGFGNLGRALRPLLAPFGGPVSVYDPWLPAGHLAEHGCRAAGLDEVLAGSQVLFVLAGVTTGNAGFLDRAALERIRPGAAVVLISRAEVVDFEAFVALAEAGRFRAAIDVFPEEPVPADHPVRRSQRILLSAHRAGGMRASYARISEMLEEDLGLVRAGLPPVRLQRAHPATAAIQRSR
jgi:phosphoglycerate dehydrogenase-like enzyme